MNGHWFCSHCDDVVFLPSRTSRIGKQDCPVCHKPAAEFVADPLPEPIPTPRPLTRPTLTAEQAKALFDKLKKI